MDQKPITIRCCPACKSSDYQLRYRKTIEAQGEQPTAVETKFRCKDCQHEWKERVPK